MCKCLFKLLILIFAIELLFVATNIAQSKNCALQVKTFSYDTFSSKKNFIENVEITLTNSKSKEKKILTAKLDNTVFENLAEGSYKISLVKKGYKKKAKVVKLECDLADKNNDVYEHVYLWRDGKNADDSDALLEYESEFNASANGKSGISLKTTDTDNDSESETKKVYGKVTVRLVIDEDGNVTSAKAIDGNELLRDLSVKAARRAKFLPTLLAGMPVKVTGDIVYNFVP